MALFQVNKSTTVRSSGEPPEALRKGLTAAAGFLQRVSPTLAARAIEPLFLSPQRHARPAHEQAAFASAERSSLLDRGLRVPLYSWGRRDRPVVLFAHGWEGRGTQVAPYLEPLQKAGFRVVAYDVPGHGEAARALVSVVDFAAVAEHVARSLGDSLQAAIGHSVGGAALTVAFGRAQLAERIALIAPPLGPRGFLAQFARWFSLSEETERALSERLDARYALKFRELDVRDSVGHTGALGLVIHDRGDLEVPFAHGEGLSAAWPEARFVATEGLGHRRVLRDPEVVRTVVDFIGAPHGFVTLESAIARELYDRELRAVASV